MSPSEKLGFDNARTPGLVGTFQDSGGGGGRHRLPPPMSGNSSWRGSPRSEQRGIERFLTTCSVRQPLALGPNKRWICASLVVNAEPGAGVEPEIELGEITGKVFLVNVLVDADEAALEDRKEAFERVHVHIAPDCTRLWSDRRRCVRGQSDGKTQRRRCRGGCPGRDVATAHRGRCCGRERPSGRGRRARQGS